MSFSPTHVRVHPKTKPMFQEMAVNRECPRSVLTFSYLGVAAEEAATAVAATAVVVIVLQQ